MANRMLVPQKTKIQLPHDPATTLLGIKKESEVAQLCLTLCDPMGCNLPGSSVHGILQARILEWVTVPSSRGSFQLSDQTRVSYVSCTGRQALLPLVPPGKPQGTMYFSSKGHLDTKSYSYDRTAS